MEYKYINDKYLIASNGFVYTIDFQKVEAHKSKKGYLAVNIDGCWLEVHKLVAEHFHEKEIKELKKKGKMPSIHHINHCKYDNDKDNIQILTQEEHTRLHHQEQLEENGFFGMSDEVKEKLKSLKIN